MTIIYEDPGYTVVYDLGNGYTGTIEHNECGGKYVSCGVGHEGMKYQKLATRATYEKAMNLLKNFNTNN